MGKKITPGSVHEAKRSWWDGKIKTTCGITLTEDSEKVGWFAAIGNKCPDCVHGRKHTH